MTEQPNPTPAARPSFSEGWTWLLLSTASHAYLVFLLTLVAIATIPLAFGWHGSVVEGGSMEPKISRGDIVLSTDLPADSPVPLGGVVEFDRDRPTGPGTMSVLHRIVHENADGTYATAGDANVEIDSTGLAREKITGQARILIPYIGLPGFWIGTSNLPPLLAWIVLTVFAIVLSCLALAPRRKHDEEPDAGPEAEDDETGDGGGSGVGWLSERTGAAGRRTFLALSVASAGAGLLALPREGTNAAFNGRTTNARNSWAVKILAPLTLGRATGYALFAGKGIYNEGSYFSTYITGGAGTSPGTAIERFAFWQISGAENHNNQAARNARADLEALYDAIGARQPDDVLGSRLSGSVRPGTYQSKTRAFTIEDTLTLDGRGDPDAIFIFTGKTITAARNSYIRLINGASAGNVFWRSSGDVTLERSSVASGNFLAADDCGVGSSADLTGRIVALAGSVRLTSFTARLPG